MSNTDIKKIISDVYQADIQSIRNLSKLANDLTNNGQLIVPGGLTIKGNLRVDGHVGVKREPHSSVGLIVNGKGLAFGIETAGAGAYIDKKLLTVGNSELKGNVKVTGSSNFKNLVNIDNAELRVVNKSRGTTHFNYKGSGNNYIRGGLLDSVIEGVHSKKLTATKGRIGGYAIDGDGSTALLWEGQYKLYSGSGDGVYVNPSQNTSFMNSWTNDKWDIIYLYPGWRITLWEHGFSGRNKTYENKRGDGLPVRLNLGFMGLTNRVSTYRLNWIGY